MKFKQSPVIFNEEEHTYHLGEKRLLGITGLIHSILGLGVYPDASEYTTNYVIPRAGSRGTAVHHAIQTYDVFNVKQTIQVVPTRYGNGVKDETWDVSAELESYIRHLDGFEPLANELTVSDNDKWASQIDNVWRYTKTGGIWLVDTKTNNISQYPVCGYFIPDYFNNGEEALREYLSWQLSIYAYLFEMENPGIEVEGLACNWLRTDDSAFWVIDRKPDTLVKELLSTDYIFLTDDEPSYFHPDLKVFGIGVDIPIKKKEEKLPIVPQDVVGYVSNLLRTYKEAEAKLDEAKKALRKAMEEHDLKSYDFGSFGASIAADSKSNSFDSKRFKADHPELYKQYVTEKTKKGGLTLKIKDND